MGAQLRGNATEFVVAAIDALQTGWYVLSNIAEVASNTSSSVKPAARGPSTRSQSVVLLAASATGWPSTPTTTTSWRACRTARRRRPLGELRGGETRMLTGGSALPPPAPCAVHLMVNRGASGPPGAAWAAPTGAASRRFPATGGDDLIAGTPAPAPARSGSRLCRACGLRRRAPSALGLRRGLARVCLGLATTSARRRRALPSRASVFAGSRRRRRRRRRGRPRAGRAGPAAAKRSRSCILGLELSCAAVPLQLGLQVRDAAERRRRRQRFRGRVRPAGPAVGLAASRPACPGRARGGACNFFMVGGGFRRRRWCGHWRRHWRGFAVGAAAVGPALAAFAVNTGENCGGPVFFDAFVFCGAVLAGGFEFPRRSRRPGEPLLILVDGDAAFLPGIWEGHCH